MKKAILHGPRDLRIEEFPLDTSALSADDVWVETQISALIGTDRGNFEGAERVPGAPDYPRFVGDSNLGIVRGIGAGVTRFEVGDRVVATQPHQSEYIISQFGDIFKVPPGVDDEDAVYAHLYALSAHCYHKALFRPGENVAVVGLGVLGLGAVALGPLFGARVVGLGNSPIRLDMAIDEAVSSAGLSGSCQGFPATPNLVLDLPDEALRGKVQTLFIQEMARRGVHCYMGFGPTLAHTEEDVCITAEAVEASLRVIKQGLENESIDDLLICDLHSEPFRRIVR